MAGTMEETFENSLKNTNYFLEVPIENNEFFVDVAAAEMDNQSKFDESMKMNTKKEERVAENLRGTLWQRLSFEDNTESLSHPL